MRRSKLHIFLMTILFLGGLQVPAFADSVNVALGKPVTAGLWLKGYEPSRLTDGDLNTFVYPEGNLTDNADGMASPSRTTWYIVDLGTGYKIDYIKLIDYGSLWTSGYNIKILASNDKTFETDVYEIVNSGLDKSITLNSNITCNASKMYRYVKIEKLAGSYHAGFQYAEFEVYANENAAPKPNIALNKPVKAGMWLAGFEPGRLTDGNVDTFVYPEGTYTDNENGVPSTKNDMWYIVDLCNEYKIDYVKLIDNTGTWSSAYNVRILASKDFNFENGVYEIINSGNDGSISLGSDIKCNSDKTFRYIKIEKFAGSTISLGYQYSELEVYPKGLMLNKFETNSEADGSGIPFENLEDVSVGGAKASVINYENTSLNIALLAALYTPAGKLVALKMNTVFAEPNLETDIAAGVGIPQGMEIGSIFKAFLWDITNAAPVPVTNVKSAVLSDNHNIYVAYNGSDSADGTIGRPYRTLEKAKTAVREIKEGFDGNINVHLREGVYCLEDTLKFNENDGGENGNYVTYSAYKKEDVTISGGKKIEGWQSYSGNIVRAPLSGVTAARELYVNGKKAVRAKSESKIRSTGYYYENSVPAGLKISGAAAASFINPEDIQLHFDIAYRTMVINVESVFVSGDSTVLKLQQPLFKAMASENISSRGITSTNWFYMENVLEMLDTPGEFYYNKSDEYIYYMTSGETIESAYVPIVENLIDISGLNSLNKAKNIRFKNLTFAHSSDNSVSENGMVVDQAQRTIYADENGNQVYGMRDASIQLNRCEGIQFINNVFTGMAKVCVGLYNGASNCFINGNVFYDTGDSALTVGGSNDAYMDTSHTGCNLALRKPTTGTSQWSEAAVDGNAYSGWSLNASDCEDGDYTKGYLQIDLEDNYVINRIEVDARMGYDQYTTRRNFEVLASNDSTFSSGVTILARCGAAAFANEGTWSQNISNKTKYRYIRVRKTENEYFFIADIRVINTSMEQTDIKEVCKNNKIYNNYITRIGDYNHAAPGIVTYYTEGTDIKHNYIYDIPYTGISSGWGWTNFPNSVTNKNNNIESNIIDTYCQICIDGGGIYTLGNQPNCTVQKNVVRNQVNAYGAVYPDDGTIGLNIHSNLFENVNQWLFIWSDNKKNILVTNNYSTTPQYVNEGTDCIVAGTTLVAPGIYTGEALQIYYNAGLEDEYKNIVLKAPARERQYTYEDLYTNVMFDAAMSSSGIKKYYLTDAIAAAENIYNLLSSSKSASVANTFNNAIQVAKNLTSTDKRTIIEAQLTLKQAQKAFIDS